MPEQEQASVALLEAVIRNDLAAVVSALEQGADIDCRGWRNATPVMLANICGFEAITRELVRRNANLLKRDRDGLDFLAYGRFAHENGPLDLEASRGQIGALLMSGKLQNALDAIEAQRVGSAGRESGET